MKSPWPLTLAGFSGDTPVNAASTSVQSQAKIVAHGIVQRFQQIHAVLAPVIGHGGVVAIYERSRYLSARSYPWLAGSTNGLGSGMDLENLKLLIGRQSDEAAAAGASCLVRSFFDLLASLIGETLTTQLLGSPPDNQRVNDSIPQPHQIPSRLKQSRLRF